MHGRQYKSGTTWCIWRWTDVDSEYITRLHLVKTPWFAVCLHWINKPDPEPYTHDHPVSFLSVLLSGGYTEYRGHVVLGPKLYEHRFFNWIPASEGWHHTITDVKPKTLTVCFMGPKTREWGFHTTKGWQYWKDYYKEKRNVSTLSI